MKKSLLLPKLLLTCLLSVLSYQALASIPITYTWQGLNTDWRDNTNWTPPLGSGIYPGQNSPTDQAVFGPHSTTTTTSVNIGDVSGILYPAPALDTLTFTDNYSLSIAQQNTLTLGSTTAAGTGIIDNVAGKELVISNSNILNFNNNSSAGGNVNNTTTLINYGHLNFNNNATAGNNVLIENGNVGNISFNNSSTLGGASISTLFSNYINFNDTSSAGISGLTQGITLSANSTIKFNDSSDASTAFIYNTGGTIDISGRATTTPNLSIGELHDTAANGKVYLGSKILTIGGLNGIREAGNDIINAVIQDGGASGGLGGSLIKAGTGTVTLVGANTYTGTTTVSQGNLTVGSGGQLGTGITTVNLGTFLNFIGTPSSSISARTIIDNGTVDVSAIMGSSPAISIGSLSSTGAVSLGATKLSLGALGALGSNDLFSGIITDGNSPSSGGSLIKTGAGTLTLTGANSYTGTTQVQAGTLTINTNGQLGTGITTVDSSAFLNFVGTPNLSTNIRKIIDNGIVDVSGMSASAISIGSLSGTGIVSLGATALTLGALDSNDLFSGIMKDPSFFAGSGGSLIKTGAGTLTLTGANSYTGSTTISDTGGITVGTGGQLGTGTTTVNSGAFLNFVGTPNLSTNVSKIIDNGIVDVSGISGSAISIGSLSGTGSVSLGNTALTLGALGSNDFFSGIIKNPAIFPANNGSLIKTGGGTLTLTGANSYNGSTTVQAGAVTVGNGGQLGSGLGLVTVNSGTSLNFTGAPLNTANNTIQSLGGTIDISQISGAGITIGELFDTNIGSIALGNKTLTLETRSSANETISSIISGSGGSLVKAGNRELVLKSANTYTGNTEVKAGTLILDHDGQLGSGLTTVDPLSTLTFNSASAFNTAITNNGTTNFNNTSTAGSAVITNNRTLSFNSGSKTESAVITNNGSLDFNNANSNASTARVINTGGRITIRQSSLSIGSLSDTMLSPGIVNLNFTRLTLGNLNLDDTIFGRISGPGSLTKIGTGTLTLESNEINSDTVPTNITDGTLVLGDSTHQTALIRGNVTVGSPTNHTPILAGFGTVRGNLDNYGVVSPGDASTLGALTVNGNFTAHPGSIFEIDIQEGAQVDYLKVTGAASLAGRVVVKPIKSLDIGLPYVIMSCGSHTGTFDDLQFAFDATFDYSNSKQVTLTFDGIKPEVANTPIAYGNQLSALAQAAGWLDDQLEERILGFAADKQIYRDHYAQPLAANDPTLWFETSAVSSKLNDDGSGFHTNPKHLAMGLEWTADDILSGFSLAYTNFHAQGLTPNVNAKAEAGLYQAGAYVRQDYWDWRLGAAADVGFTSAISTQQSYMAGGQQVVSTSSSHASQLSAQAEAVYTGLQFNPHFSMQPLAALIYRYVGRGGFAEEDNVHLGYIIGHAGNTSVRSQLGAAFEAPIDAGVHPFGFLVWEHEYANNATDLKANLSSISTILNTSGASIGREALATKLGITKTTMNKVWNFSAYYEGRFARSYSENAAKVALNYSF